MFWWGFVCLRFGLRFNRGEELRSHHLCRALKHSLTDPRNRTPNLYVAGVINARRAIHVRQINITAAL
jgi:hypothetical protein